MLEEMNKFIKILRYIRTNTSGYSHKNETFNTLMSDLDVELSNMKRLSKTIDRTLGEELDRVIESTKLESIIQECLFLLENKTRIPTEEIVRLRKSLFFIENVIKKLITYLKNNISQDNDVFEPSNIDKEYLIEHLDKAIDAIEHTVIKKEEQRILINYIQETKAEISKPKTIWKNVIGGLVIVATIVSGIAGADDAIENLNKAFIHISGKSVSKNVPLILDPVKEPDFEGQYILEDQSLDTKDDEVT